MKIRIFWFILLYIIFIIFVVYDLIYLGVIWGNRKLLHVYNIGFKVSGQGSQLFAYANGFAVFGLATMGTLFSIFALIFAILSQSFILKLSSPRSRFVVLITSFSILKVGFFLDFIGQLFYEEWNDSTLKITSSQGIEVAATFYNNWISLANIWVIFTIFFILGIFCVFIIIKINNLNIELFKFDKKENYDNLSLEIMNPIYSSLEFDPNETQTITLNINTDSIMPKDIKRKKKTKVKRN